jgi:hypothetical protein
MKNGAIVGAARLVSSPGSGDFHVSVVTGMLRIGASIHVDCEAVHATKRAAGKDAFCRACWTYPWHSLEHNGLDLSRSLTTPRSSGAYAHGMNACEGVEDLQAVSSRATPGDHGTCSPSLFEPRVLMA